MGSASPLLWVLVDAKFCFCPPRLESLLPSVLWKACNQILLALKVRFPEVSVPLSDPRTGKTDVRFRTLTVVQELLWYYSPVCESPTWQVWDFIMNVPLLQSLCSFFFVFGHGVSSYGGFQHPPVDGCSIASCKFDAVAGRDEPMSFYSAILNQKPMVLFIAVFY